MTPDHPPARRRAEFDAAYYRRFYGDRPVHTRARVGHLCEGVLGLAAWWGVPVRSVLDVGAGPGFWRDWFADNRPRVRYRSIDASEHACARYGHEQGDITTLTVSRPYDLVVCQGVLHYLGDAAAAIAIGNLATATRSLLYLEAPTAHDRDHVLDHDRSDLAVHFRSGSWYRKRLGPHFIAVGAGLYAKRDRGPMFYELERAARPERD